MAKKDNIALLSKYQMRVLYYKCKEGATHEEIATFLGRDVNTVQYHMTKIYKVLGIRKAGKSREEMESELKNEICPIIRQMFHTYDDVKIWAPVIKDRHQVEMDEPIRQESQPSYFPPPRVQKVLGSSENQSNPPQVLEPPPPGRRRISWWMIVGPVAVGILLVILLKVYPLISAMATRPTHTPQPVPTPIAFIAVPTEAPTRLPVPSPSPVYSTQVMIDQKDGMVLVHIPAGEFEMGSSKAEDSLATDE